MKKFILLGLLFAIASIVTTGCSSCQTENNKQDNENVFNGVSSQIVVENVVSTDREEMYLMQKDYTWYETQIVLSGYIDEDAPAAVSELRNVFQYQSDGCFMVQYFLHSAEQGKCVPSAFPGLWIEDESLNDAEFKITFAQALERLYESNLPKAHSKYCYIRKPVGPKACNAQYIFGDLFQPIFVDAVTGVVSSTNPAFIPETK